jgi:hypothetical protein
MFLLSGARTRAAFADEFQGEPPPEERHRRYQDYDDDDNYNPPKTPPQAPGDTGITDRPDR